MNAADPLFRDHHHLQGSSDAVTVASLLIGALGEVIVDQDRGIRLTIAGLLSGGHVLLEGTPGVGKTTIAKALVAATGTNFGRVQGTADLLPTDITGVNVYDQRTGEWVFRAGPLMHNVVLFDEINRATPRAQSALLEAMAEGQVTVDGERHLLPEPFFLIATQNPAGDFGTYPLVAGQRDRFALVVPIRRPSRSAERQLLVRSDLGRVDDIVPVVSAEDLRMAIASTAYVHVASEIADYTLDIVDAVRAGLDGRSSDNASGSLSPRASRTMLRVAQAWAVTNGRTYVIPDDIRAVAVPALAHRLLRSGDDRLAALADWVDAVVRTVALP